MKQEHQAKINEIRKKTKKRTSHGLLFTFGGSNMGCSFSFSEENIVYSPTGMGFIIFEFESPNCVHTSYAPFVALLFLNLKVQIV
jgi:hypothetical protein